MQSNPEPVTVQRQGNVVRLSEHRSIAIYQRHGVAWVVDFTHGVARLSPAVDWFRLNRRVFAHACRHGADSTRPISDAEAVRIERLHLAQTRPTALSAGLRRARQRISRWWRSASASHRYRAGGV